jgi:hypothetical protein
VEAEIAAIAGREDGVIGLERLLALGLSHEQVRLRVTKSSLIRLYPTVFGVGHKPLTARGHLRAALMAGGSTSFLDGRTAAADYSLRPLNLKAIEVTVVSAWTPPSRPPLIVHRTNAPPHRSEIKIRDGFRVSSVPRLLINLSTRETPTELMRLITVAVRKGCLDFGAMEGALERHERRPGVGILKGVYDRYRPGPDRKSGLELSFDAYAATDRRIPPYETNVSMPPYEIDCMWAKEGVALELDGRPYHRALADTERDHAKDAWLQSRGLYVIRITDFRWEYDRAGAVLDLLGLLQLGRRRAA